MEAMVSTVWLHCHNDRRPPERKSVRLSTIGGRRSLRALGFPVARTITLRTRALAPAVGTLTAVARPLAHGALARSTARIALLFMFRHDALYSTEPGGSCGLN